MKVGLDLWIVGKYKKTHSGPIREALRSRDATN